MKKTQRKMQWTMAIALTLFSFCSLWLISISPVRADASEPKPAVTLAYNSGKMTATVSGYGETHSYQYWKYTKVETVNEGETPRDLFVWQIISGGTFADNTYDTTNNYASLEFDVGDEDLFEGCYQVLVRVAEQSISGFSIVDELYCRVTPTSTGQAVLDNDIYVNGVSSAQNMYVVDGTEVSILFTGYNASKYYLYLSDKAEPVADSGASGNTIVWDISDTPEGMYQLRLVAEGNSGGSAEKKLQVYVYKVYEIQTNPIIKSLSMDTAEDTVTFTVNAEFANGGSVEGAGLYYKLSINSKIYYPDTNSDGVFTLSISEDLGGYGIYPVYAYVSRTNAQKADDSFLEYFNHRRTGTSTHSVESKLADGEYNGSYSNSYTTAQLDSGGITIKTDASLALDTGSDEKLLYSYYRYDATGYVLVRDWSEDPLLTWNPARGGTYQIISRVKGSLLAGSYEMEVSRQFVITGGASVLDAQKLEVASLTYERTPHTGDYEVRKPYVFQAMYDNHNEEVLYKFMVWDAGLKNVIAQHYSPTGSFVFISNKPVVYKITVEVIANGNFGYKDVSGEAITVNCVKPKIVLASVEVTSNADKTVYLDGDTFNPAGMVIQATYTDGSKVPGITDFDVLGTALDASNAFVTVSYTDDGVTKTCAYQVDVYALSGTIVDHGEGTEKIYPHADPGTNYKISSPYNLPILYVGENGSLHRLKLTMEFSAPAPDKPYFWLKTTNNPSGELFGIDVTPNQFMSHDLYLTPQGDIMTDTFAGIDLNGHGLSLRSISYSYILFDGKEVVIEAEEDSPQVLHSIALPKLPTSYTSGDVVYKLQVTMVLKVNSNSEPFGVYINRTSNLAFWCGGSESYITAVLGYGAFYSTELENIGYLNEVIFGESAQYKADVIYLSYEYKSTAITLAPGGATIVDVDCGKEYKMYAPGTFPIAPLPVTIVENGVTYKLKISFKVKKLEESGLAAYVNGNEGLIWVSSGDWVERWWGPGGTAFGVETVSSIKFDREKQIEYVKYEYIAQP